MPKPGSLGSATMLAARNIANWALLIAYVKCFRGGAAIGHPEWKSQPLVLVKESDRSVWIIDNPSSLSGLEGQRVRADVEINAARKAVHVKRVAEASERNP